MANIGTNFAGSLLALMAAFSFDGEARAHGDSFPPPALKGNVDDDAADFSYSSDAEIKESGQNTLHNAVCNEDKSNGLVFKWEKTRLVRGVLNPLPPGKCQINPHPVYGIEEYADTNAPILYTQAKRRRDAAAYMELPPPKSKKQSFIQTFRSLLDTAFWNKEKEIQPVTVGLEVALTGPGDAVRIRITRRPADLTIGIGSLFRLIDDRAFKTVSAQLDYFSKAGGEFSFKTVRETLTSKDDYNWMPPVMTDDWLFVFIPGKSAVPVIEFSVPVTKELLDRIIATPGSIFVLDQKGRLISTGKATLLLPR